MRFLFIALAVLAGCASTTASQKDRARAQIQYDIAVAEMNKGDFRAALRDLLIAIEADATLPQAHNALGLVYHALGRRDESLHHYQEAVRLDPAFSQAHNNLGTLLTEVGRYEEAITHFDKAVSDILYPTPSLAEGNMGWAFYKKGDVEQGVKHLRNAVATNPKFCRGYEWLMRIGLDVDDAGQVIDNCRRFDKYCRKDQEIFDQIAPAYRQEIGYYCGLGYLKAGDQEAARAELQACADPDGGAFATRCAESLGSLR